MEIICILIAVVLQAFEQFQTLYIDNHYNEHPTQFCIKTTYELSTSALESTAHGLSTLNVNVLSSYV